MSARFPFLLFDLDGTLVDSRHDLADAVNVTLKALGRPPQREEEILPHVGNGLRQLLHGVWGGADDATLRQAIPLFTAHYQEHCVDKTALYPEVFPTLEALASQCKMGVVTNKPVAFSEKILAQLKVAPFFPILIGGDSLPEKKPSPRPLLAALEALKRTNEPALMIGDGLQDMQAAAAASVSTGLATYGYGSKAASVFKPDFIIERFSTLKEIVL